MDVTRKQAQLVFSLFRCSLAKLLLLFLLQRAVFMGWVPRVPVMPNLNITSLLYHDTAHFYWSFDGAQQLSSTSNMAENLYSPWTACNTSNYMAVTTDSFGRPWRIRNTGTTSTINRCEKWPPVNANGYFDLKVQAGPQHIDAPLNVDLYNVDATHRLCSQVRYLIANDPYYAVYYPDVQRYLFDGNCVNQILPCNTGNTEDCMVFNLDPTITDETKKDCIYIGNFNVNPEKFWQEKCLVNPSKCEANGFTASMWIKYNYTWLATPGATRFLMGTDYASSMRPNESYINPGDYPSIGWGLWHYTSTDGQQHYLRVTVTDVNYLYMQDVVITDGSGVIWPANDDTADSFWTNIGFRWQRSLTVPTWTDYFIDVFIFGRQCLTQTSADEDPGCILVPNSNSTSANTTGVYPMTWSPTNFVNATGIYVGCQGDASGANRYHFTSAVIDDVAFWAWRLRDEEIPYMLGGKAMPKININPNLAKIVSIPVEPVNPYYAMADIFYKLYALEVVTTANTSYQPSPYFVKPVQPLLTTSGAVDLLFQGRADPMASTSNVDSTLLTSTYAIQLRNSSAFIYVDRRIVSGAITPDCPHSISGSACPNGFSLSIWVFIPTTASLRIMNDHYTIIRNMQLDQSVSDRTAKTWELYTEGNHVFVRVGSASPMQFPGDCTPMLGRWTNLAFSWRSDIGIRAYINGLPQAFVPLYPQLTKQTVMGAPAVTPNLMDSHANQSFRANDIIIGSDGYLSSALAGMAFNDLAIWQTYIYPFETYKFLGLSEKESVVLWNATWYWVTDYFITRDRALYWEKLGGMWLYPNTGVIQINVTGSDVKGKTLMTTNSTIGFLGLRDPVSNNIAINQSSNCLANPAVCDTTGATYGIWVFINQSITAKGRTYIFTSGNIDEHCIGVAIWLGVDTTSVPNPALFVQVSRYSDFNAVKGSNTATYAEWHLGVPAMDIQPATWYHLSITWSLDAGLYFFINGVVRGWASRASIVGVDSITDAKPQWRFNNYTVLGINPFYNGIMNNTGYVSFEMLGVYQTILTPLDVPKYFGLIENPWFGRAKVWYDKYHLITNWQQQLYEIRLAIVNGQVSSRYGYTSGLSLTPLSARFNQPTSLAPLLAVPATGWVNNVTICIWFKINQQLNGQVIFATDKYFNSNYSGGVFVRTEKAGLNVIACGIVASWAQLIPTVAGKSVPRWNHLAIVFNNAGSATPSSVGTTSCWFNGVQMIKSYTSPGPQLNNNPAPGVYAVGGLDASLNGTIQDFEIYQLAIYPIAASDISQLGMMMGMPYQEAIYLITSNYYWSFDGPAHDLFVPFGSLQLPADASFVIDKYIQGRALNISGSSKSCVNLGNFAGTCLTNVSLCSQSGFTMSMWLKLTSLSATGQVFSTGGQVPGEPGIAVMLNQGNLAVSVSNGTYKWTRLRIFIQTTDLWFNLMFRWNLTGGLEVYLNGQQQTDDITYPVTEVIRNANQMYIFTNATVGCSNSDMSRVVPMAIDDIWFIANYSITPLTTDECPASAIYRNLFLLSSQLIDTTTSVAPYNQIKHTYATPVFEVTYPSDWKSGTQMDADKMCPGDLSKCPNGFTFSFWFMLPSLKQFNKPLIQLRSSTYQGIAVWLDNSQLQQSMHVQIYNNSYQWLVTIADYVDTNKWLQITAAWDTRQLTVYTLNRQYAPVYPIKSTGSNPDWTATYSIGTTLDSGVWQYYVEDIQVWNRYLSNLKAYPSGVSCVNLYTDYIADDLPTPPVLTSSIAVSGVCYLSSDDGKQCLCTKEQWDRGAISSLTSVQYFKILVLLQGDSVKSSSVDDLGLDKYQLAVTIQDLISVKKQIMNGAVMTITDRTVEGLNLTAYNYIKLCSDVSYLIQYKEMWLALAAQGDSAMGVADAIDVFGSKVLANMPLVMNNDSMNYNNSIDIHTDNIIFTAEAFPEPSSGANRTFYTSYAFPNYERIKSKAPSFGKKWARGDTADSIVIPASVLNSIQCTTCKGKVKLDKITVVAVLYDAMGNFVPPALDSKSPLYRSDVATSNIKMISRIISVTFNPPITVSSLNDIRVTLQHSTNVPVDQMAFCAFYTSDSTWDTTGCKVINTTATATICSCTHLTNFAVLMQPVPIKVNPIDSLVLSIISYVGLIISMLALMSLFYLFVTKSKLHNERNTIHINLVVALFLANLCFLFTGPAAYFRLFCRACAALMHYFYTATFMWLLMEATYLFNAVVSGVIKGRLCCMIPLSWGVPVLIVAAVLIVDPEAYGGDDRCWLSFDKGFIFAFIGPIILIVILNAALLGLVVYNMPNTVLRRDTKFYGKVLRGIRHAAVLLPLFGVTWLFGLFAVNQSLIVFQYLFVIFNSLQGFFIFLGFGWFQPDVRRYMCSRDDDMDDEDDPHKDVVSSESDLKTILSTMPPPTPELDRKHAPGSAALTASFAVNETETAAAERGASAIPGSAVPGAPPSAVPQSARQMSAMASARARTSFMRPATSLMRPKSSVAFPQNEDGTYTEEDTAQTEEDAKKARELMEYLLDGKRVKDVPDFVGETRRYEPSE